MKIFHKNKLNRHDEEITAKQLAKLPILLQKKIGGYRSLKKQQQRIDGLLLLEEAILYFELDTVVYNLNTLQYTENGKPFFDDIISFSLAYSDGCSVLVFSKNSCVGIDIEKIKPIAINDYKPYFTVKEWGIIATAANQHLQFYTLWTRKEAVAKAIGSGIFMVFEELEVLHDVVVLEQKWAITTEILDGDYVLSVVEEIR